LQSSIGITGNERGRSAQRSRRGPASRRKIYAETRAERLAALSAKGVLGQERKRLEALRDEIGRVDAETGLAKRRELLPEAAAT